MPSKKPSKTGKPSKKGPAAGPNTRRKRWHAEEVQEEEGEQEEGAQCDEKEDPSEEGEVNSTGVNSTLRRSIRSRKTVRHYQEGEEEDRIAAAVRSFIFIVYMDNKKYALSFSYKVAIFFLPCMYIYMFNQTHE